MTKKQQKMTGDAMYFKKKLTDEDVDEENDEESSCSAHDGGVYSSPIIKLLPTTQLKKVKKVVVGREIEIGGEDSKIISQVDESSI